MASPWGAVPLGVGVLWFPLQGVGFAISDGVGLVLGGSPGPPWDTFSSRRAVHRPRIPHRA